MYPESISRPVFPRLFIFLLLLSGCTQIDLYEKNTVMPGMNWSYNFNPSGAFIITDTAVAYNIYIVLRHTDAYRYNNIWLETGLQAPGDSMRFSKLNLALGSDAGGWEGSGMNDIWEVRKLVSGGPQRFAKKGEYRFVIKQVMRDNPLAAVMSAGLRVERYQ